MHEGETPSCSLEEYMASEWRRIPSCRLDTPTESTKDVSFSWVTESNQDLEAATFADMGNASANLESGRLADCYGACPGNASEHVDGVQAFASSEAGGPILKHIRVISGDRTICLQCSITSWSHCGRN